MSNPAYFKNPLLKAGFQKNSTIGDIPGTQVTVQEINQLQGVTSNVQAQLNALNKRVYEVSTAAELDAALSEYDITNDCRIISLKKDINFRFGDGQTGKTYYINNSIIIDGNGLELSIGNSVNFYCNRDSILFYNVSIGAWDDIDYVFKIILDSIDSRLTFDNCSLALLDYPHNPFLYITDSNSWRNFIVSFNNCVIPFFYQYVYVDDPTLIIKSETNFPTGDMYLRINACNFQQPLNNGHKLKIAVITNGPSDMLVIDNTINYNTAYALPPRLINLSNKAGALTADSITTTGNITAGGNLATTGNITVSGDLTVNGTTTTVHAETIETENDFIELRKNNPLALATGDKSGLTIDNYDGTGSSAHIVTDNTGTLYCGDEDSLEPLCTRDTAANLNNNRLLKWDSATSSAKDSGFAIAQMTVEDYEELAVKDNNTIYLLY